MMSGQITDQAKRTLLEVIAQMFTVDPAQPDTVQGIDVDPTGDNVIVQTQVWDHADNVSRVFVTAVRPDGSTDSYEEH